MIDPVINFGNLEVSTTYSDVSTAITLATGETSKLPDPSIDGEFNLVWFDSLNYPEVYDDPNVEIVRITAISGDILTVTRAQESTLATTKSTGGGEYRMILSPTKKTIDDIRLDIADLMPVNYEIRIQEDSGDSDISYVGKAVPGSLTASAIWQVARVDENTGTIQEWADGNDSFDNVWDNREALTYT